MSESLFTRIVRKELAPPRYLAPPAAGIAISASGVKLAVVEERMHGLELVAFDEARLPLDAVKEGEFTDRASIVDAVRTLGAAHKVRFAHIALPEAKSYLFETDVPAGTRSLKAAVRARLEEYVPLASTDVAFDVVPAGAGDAVRAVGIAYARRVIEESLSVFDEAGITVNAVESETFAMARALLPAGNEETLLIIDIGRTTTKLAVVSRGIPRFATTLDIGGHALTLAVQKHFGVTEEEARRIKVEQGLSHTKGNEEYLAAMLSTVAAIREEIATRLSYWQARAVPGSGTEPVTRALLAGGNATVRGLGEYFETALEMPVALADVFVNLAPRDVWVPSLDYHTSLGYATAVGLALRDYAA